MSHAQHPVRLLESEQLAPDLRGALTAYAAEAPQLERRARMLANLEQQLGFSEAPSAHAGGAEGAQPSLGAAPTAGSGAGVGALFKFKLLLSALATIGASMGLFAVWSSTQRVAPAVSSSVRSRAEAPRTSTAGPAETAQREPASVPPTERESSAGVSTAVADSPLGRAASARNDEPPAPVPRPRRVRVVAARAAEKDALSELPGPRAEPKGAAPAPAHAAGATDAVTELTLLARARRALLAEPERSLALAEQHAREFPHGTLCEEREVLAIESLLKLGLVDRARQRALLFQQRFPSSAHRAHLARMIALPVR